MNKISDKIDKTFPRRGRCSMCGHPDARHHIFEHIQTGFKNGVSVERLAKEFQIPKTAVILIIEPVNK